MSYFRSLKLTKKGEQLQAKINGNLSETLIFTKAKVGSGRITSDDEIRFLTDIKETWETASVSKCEFQGTDNTVVVLELQFSNRNLVENKIFREIGLYARGNDGQEILYAYANAGDNYDYIPLMQDSPHSFIITIYFTITSGTKIDVNIDLNSYISLKKFNEEMAKKIDKTSKSDSVTSNSSETIATSLAVKTAYDRGSSALIEANKKEHKFDKNTAFNKNFGTVEGTVLEGNKFNQIVGKDYGGLLNTPGLKIAGKAYFDNNTKKLYICKNNNSDISANVNNYIPFDSHSILERLENLYSNAFYHPDRWSPTHENQLLKTGLYQLKGSQTSLKNGFVGSQAFIMVFNTGLSVDDWITQIAISYYAQHSMAIRTRTGDTKVWTPWRYISTS